VFLNALEANNNMKDTWELHGYGKDLDSRLKKIKEGKGFKR
jgi:hypothetical protein